MPLEAMATYTVDYTGIPGHVYTLLLESGRFYVGWSSAVENRIAQHFSGARLCCSERRQSKVVFQDPFP